VAGGGSLRTYLGIAPGVGKTFAMLAEGRHRAENGERVVVGWIESHGRPETSRQLGGLEVIAPRTAAYRGTVFADFDAQAAIDSGAEVVLVDELAHATADRTRQRWQDVADVLRAGLDVVTTMNVAHLRSVRDYAARITGVGSVACVPDEFVRAGEVVLVDLPAEALRQRIASGAVYSAGQVGGALADYFRAANLRALSELARAWMAGTAETAGEELLARRGLAEPPAPPGIHVTSIGHPIGMKRGQLRVYLGAAPGVGKTYAMLGEGHRRLARGTDVVIGFAETYNRKLMQGTLTPEDTPGGGLTMIVSLPAAGSVPAQAAPAAPFPV